jgi:ABC-type branched-subunit amino acid transport system ATPase component
MTTLLEAKDVSRSFGGVKALAGCSLSVDKGSITGLIGPNGSGKTTLFNVMTGYVKPEKGTVFFDGHDVTNARPNKIFALGVGRTF